MLTWGAFNIVGATGKKRAEIEASQKKVAAVVDAQVTRLGIEHDRSGNRAKAYLYCLETRCPKTGWMVPMLGTRVVSKSRSVVVKLIPDPTAKRYAIEIHAGVSSAEMDQAEHGTVQDGRLVHPMNSERTGVEIKTVRGDYRNAKGVNKNRLRLWEKADFGPRHDDIFQERLYCIHWIAKESLGTSRPETFFAGVTDEDLARERKVEAIVRENLARWQQEGLVPDIPIEPGDKTDEPIRTRGWTYWHHLFCARQLLLHSLYLKEMKLTPELVLGAVGAPDWNSKICRWNPTWDKSEQTFYNQAINPFWNFGVRATPMEVSARFAKVASEMITGTGEIHCVPAVEAEHGSELILTDPPYADAINYHEITEFFIAWLRKNARHRPSTNGPGTHVALLRSRARTSTSAARW